MIPARSLPRLDPKNDLKVDLNKITDEKDWQTFKHADAYLNDVYGMFRMLPPGDGDGGGGNFVIALALCCVIDGLAIHRFPKCSRDNGQHFKCFVRNYFWWPPYQTPNSWMDQGAAARHLYTKLRNPLTHSLLGDIMAKGQVIAQWGLIGEVWRDISKIDALDTWKAEWPLIRKQNDSDQAPYILSNPTLYWQTKNAARRYLKEVAGLS